MEHRGRRAHLGAAPGPRLGRWRAAALTGPQRGLLVGERGRIATFGGGELRASPTAPGGLPALHAVTLRTTGDAPTDGPAVFACGDGGRLWAGDAAGRLWRPIAGPLPTRSPAAGGGSHGSPHYAAAADLDLRGLWAQGNAFAVCGDPGGVVFVRAARRRRPIALDRRQRRRDRPAERRRLLPGS